jgi:hypothetical protein
MHAVRTPVFGIGFAFVLLLLETLGARAYISDRFEQQARVERRERAIREATSCPSLEALPYVEIPQACLDNPIAKGCE